MVKKKQKVIICLSISMLIVIFLFSNIRGVKAAQHTLNDNEGIASIGFKIEPHLGQNIISPL